MNVNALTASQANCSLLQSTQSFSLGILKKFCALVVLFIHHKDHQLDGVKSQSCSPVINIDLHSVLFKYLCPFFADSKRILRTLR
jgi:hypothetical protein